MINCLKVACLFIGAIVGAGFATGREIVVFFRGLSILTPIFAGIVTGIMCAVFLNFGKIKFTSRLGKAVNGCIDYMMLISMIITYMVMCSAAEELSRECLNMGYVGLISGVCFAVLSLFDIKFIKNISMIMVGVIIAFVIFLSFGTKMTSGSQVDFATSVKYCAMNMLSGGYLISQEGKDMKGKHIAICALICGGVTAGLLGMVYVIAMSQSGAPMPVYAAAVYKGCKYMGGILILLAVLSTMLGAGRIIYTSTFKLCGATSIPLVFLIGLACISYTLNFEQSVEIFYPPLGVLGIILCAAAIIIIITATVIKFKRRYTLKL
ncbi:MAG: hypothetical protein K2I79_01645 [Clostridia bacterium]|nr:hypothetical protein [Clostridia bacterium]